MTQIPIETLDEALLEIERLRLMLASASVVRVDVEPPVLIDGVYRMRPIFTAVGISEEVLAAEVGKVVTACLVAVMMAAEERTK